MAVFEFFDELVPNLPCVIEFVLSRSSSFYSLLVLG